ncbi:protein-glutamate O-methyltransferase CheR [Roseomonas alkaliterrae]|uniref:protein-glutamate O-methyltransferase n=1 Tax=Neoroseomonas alkaliterrae TaxID=1452450 RepID=A0A840YAC9_9PROT|nr:protein-glutamate O-methyltransferase CheR [Neoroseomonas alkaliterrae]MBB5690834.1 chemotaxis protein methyltransferase CheR [Neoroseomonas alkaliterrae]MBR0677812.1 protein-glutamate O-methyltransferase CheR [Neoroseomonas alkaliterrae]
MTPESFNYLAGLVKARSGIVLTADKGYMLETRLGAMLRREGLAGLDALALRLRGPRAEPLVAEMVEALTTNESSFFRDGKPFEHLKRLLPRLAAARPPGQAIRIWSAACSSGQEAYSVAMTVADLGAALGGRRVEILGTDISREMLDRAKEGVFTQFEVQRGLPVQMLVKHFRQEGGRWRVAPELRAMTRWQAFNLLDDPRGLGRFDVIFCRNVLIYFDAPTKSRVLAALAGQLAPDGVVYLGGAETVLGLTERLVPVSGERGVYEPARPAARAG